MSHDFQIVNADTDSISFCLGNQLPLTKETRMQLIKELNDLSPEFMTWADDGYYKKIIVLAGKNYVKQKENGEIEYKGSAIKAKTKSQAMKNFIKEVFDILLKDDYNYEEIQQLYMKYVNEILDVKDIKRFSDRKTLTAKTFESTRLNEIKIVDAIQGSEYKEGDRIWTFFKSDKTLSLVENFNGDYDQVSLLKKLYNTLEIFDSILDVKQFKNYSLVKGQKELGIYVKQN